MDVLAYQKEAIDIINKAFETNHLSHAYIFEGASGTGVLDAAYYFSQMLLCKGENKPCHICDNCEKIEHRVHPNIFLIEPISESIRKDQINSMIHEGHMSSITDKARIYIIKDAEKMNRASSNTLLKTLEEPSNDNYIILLCSNINTLLETIVSRCQIIRFKPINKLQVEDLLMKKDIESDKAFLLSELFSSFDEAYDFYNNSNAYLDYILKSFNNLSLNKDIYLDYIFNKNHFSNKQNVILYLQSLIIFEKELLKYLNNQSIHFASYINKINKETLTIDKIIENIELINDSLEKVLGNVSFELVFSLLSNKLIKGE